MSFKRIIGHDRIIAMLQKGVEGDMLPNAYIFSGLEGVGKMLTALELAKAIQCVESAKDGCGECPSCLKIASGNHPDLLIIDKGDEKIKVEDIRECRTWLSYKPYGKKRVVIINQAETITPQGGNAFLKTLEEPPENTLIILVTTNLHSLLPTIVSRCRMVRFNRLSYSDVENIAVKEYNLAKPEAAAIASLSNGSINPAAFAIGRDEIAMGRDLSLTLLKESLAGNLEYILTATTPLLSDRGKLSVCLDLMSNIVRDIALIVSGESEKIISNRDIIDSLSEMSGRVSLKWAVTAFDMVKEAKQALNRNANTRLLLEELLIGIRYAAKRG